MLKVTAWTSALEHLITKYNVTDDIDIVFYNEQEDSPAVLFNTLLCLVAPEDYVSQTDFVKKLQYILTDVLMCCCERQTGKLAAVFAEEPELRNRFWNCMFVNNKHKIIHAKKSSLHNKFENNNNPVAKPKSSLLKRRRDVPDTNLTPATSSNAQNSEDCRQKKIDAANARIDENKQRGMGDMNKVQKMQQRSEARSQQTALAKRSLPSCSATKNDDEHKIRRLNKKQSLNTPDAHSSSLFTGYFEKQHLARCGLHALNNIAGGPFFNHDDMIGSCKAYLEESEFAGIHERQEEHADFKTGWYSEAVLSYAFRWKYTDVNFANQDVVMKLDLDRPINFSVDSLNRIYDANITLGILVHESNPTSPNHWTAIRYYDNNIWLLDSLKPAAQQMNHSEYVCYIKTHRNAFAVVDSKKQN